MTEKLSIAYVFDSTYKPAEGVARYIETLGEYYREQGHNVSYIVGSSIYDNPSVYPVARMVSVKANGNHVDLPLPISKRKARDLLEKIRPDILHIQAPYGPIGWRFANEASKETAIIGTFHSVPKSTMDKLRHNAIGMLSRRSLRHFDRMISVSPAAKEVALNTYGIDSEVIPCPVNLNKFKVGKRLHQYDDGKFNIVFLGRLEERKGCQHLLSAVGLIDVSTLSKTRVIIAGDGPLLPKLQLQSSSLGLDEAVSFLGFIDDEKVADLFASADIAVFPATGGESFGIILVEAIASGAGVVIGGDNAGYRFVLGDNKYLFDPTNEKSLAQYLTRIISYPKGLVESHAYQHKELGRFDVAIVGSKIMEIYKTILKKKKSTKTL